MDELGDPIWNGDAELPSLADVPPRVREAQNKITLSNLIEDHAAYAPLSAAARLVGFAVRSYEEARSLLDAAGRREPLPAVAASTRLEFAITSLHRAADHIEAIRVRLGGLPGLAVRSTAPATRGPSPIAISKLEKRMIGDLDALRNLRNALEHADERILAETQGDTMLVPRGSGVSLDDTGLSYDEFGRIARGIIALVHDILDAGSAAPANENCALGPSTDSP